MNSKHIVFAESYVRNFGNGAKAARVAGYSPKSAKRTAHKLLQREDVKEYIAELERSIALRRLRDLNEIDEQLILTAKGAAKEETLAFVGKGMQTVVDIGVSRDSSTRAALALNKIMESNDKREERKKEQELRLRVLEAEARLKEHAANMLTGAEGLNEFQQALVDAVGKL